MSDDIGISRQAKNNYAIYGLTVTTILIGWTTYFGNPANSLHVSAQAWAFAGFFGVLASRGFDTIVNLWKK